MTKITSWGKYPTIDANINTPVSPQSLVNEIQTGIPRGLGRSYGDSAISKNVIVSKQLNNFLSFPSKNI